MGDDTAGLYVASRSTKQVEEIVSVMSDTVYEFENGTGGILRLTEAEYREMLRSNKARLDNLFAADVDALQMRQRVEGA